jgi:hypothetical protein
MKPVNYEIIKNKYERRVIISQSYPKLIFNTNFSKYSGVYDLNSIQAKYLNFTFDVDVNFAKNLRVEFSILQNLYSGEKIYDLKRINKKKSGILKLKKERTKFEGLKTFIEKYSRLLIMRNEISLLKVRYSIAKNKWSKLKNRIMKGGDEYSLNEKQLNNLKNLYELKKNGFIKEYDEFLKKTKMITLDIRDIDWQDNIFNYNENFLDIDIIKRNISLLYIQKRLNSDNFKPTIDLFFTYGLQDDDMETLDDGYTAGIVINWNIFDGFKDKYNNKVLDVNIKEKNETLNKLRKESRRNFDFIRKQIDVLNDYYENERIIISILKGKLDRKGLDLEKGIIGRDKFLQSKRDYLEENEKFLKYSREYILNIYNMALLSNNIKGFWRVVK